MAYVHCPHCGTQNRHRESSIGLIVHCAGCGKKYTLTSVGGVATGRVARKSSSATAVVVLLMILFCGGVALFRRNEKPGEQPKVMNAPQPVAAVADQKTAPAVKHESETPAAKDDERELLSVMPTRVDQPAKAATAKSDDMHHHELDEAMLRYELAKLEYHGWSHVRLGRRLLIDADDAEARGNDSEASKTSLGAKEWLRDTIERYPNTEASAEAKLLLAGKKIKDRPQPALPILPKDVQAKEHDVLAKSFDKERRLTPMLPSGVGQNHESPVGPAVSPGGGSANLVYVRGYHRKNGTYVAPHYRRRSS